MAYNPHRLLAAFLRKGTVPHAILFTGIEGVGKRTAALNFAMSCNCENAGGGQENCPLPLAPCHTCRSCKKILSGNHPDVSMIEPSGPLIRIAQIREICHTLGMKPYQARMRAVIIADAHTMNPEAGNALLKLLEEPPDRTILILTAIQTSDLLPTIVSRCQHIRFHPASQDHLRNLLTGENPGFSEKTGFRCLSGKEAEIIARLANGSYSKAISMSRSNWIRRRQWLMTELESLFLSKQRGDPHSAGRVLAFAEKLSKNKEILPELLELTNTWVRDLMICKYDAEKIINRDLGDKIQNISRKMTAADLLSKTEALQSAQKKLRANANVRLTMEALAVQLAW